MDLRAGTIPREIVDDFGDPWRIREIDCRGQPGARANWCLIVENSAIVRRIWLYPERWMELDDHALTVVCGI